MRPTDKKNVVIWWKYAAKRVMDLENIPSKVFTHSISTYIEAEKYKFAYTKRQINPRGLTPAEKKMLEKFENENSLPFIIQYVLLLNKYSS